MTASTCPGVEQTPGDAGLVADDADRDACRADTLQRLRRAGHGAHRVGVAVVGDVDDEGAVAVEQHRTGPGAHGPGAHHGPRDPARSAPRRCVERVARGPRRFVGGGPGYTPRDRDRAGPVRSNPDVTALEGTALIRTQRPEDRGPGAPRDVEVRVLAQPEALVTVRTVAGDLAARAEFPLDAVDDLRLAVDEACTCLAGLARPGTKLTVTFTVDDDRITVTSSVSTTGPTGLPTTTFAWRVLTVLADDVRVLSEAPTAPGEAHRLALRMTLVRPALGASLGDVDEVPPRDAAVSFMPERPGRPGP